MTLGDFNGTFSFSRQDGPQPHPLTWEGLARMVDAVTTRGGSVTFTARGVLIERGGEVLGRGEGAPLHAMRPALLEAGNKWQTSVS